jgi:hypothetical protein
MTESNQMNDLNGANKANEIEFHEQVGKPAGQSVGIRVGIVAGSALLFVIGAMAVMGASRSPSTGADPAASSAPLASSAPAASSAPNASSAPGTTKSNGDRRGLGPGGFGPGGFGRIGFRAITITAISGSDISLKTEDGWTRTISVTTTTKITKGGATIALGDLAVGDQIRFAQQRATDGTYSVTAIAVVLPTVAGQVKTIDGNTLTVTQPDGTTATIHVAAGTTYRVNGATGALSDIKVGSFVIAQGTKRSDGSLDATAVRGGTVGRGGLKGPGFRGGHDGANDPSASPAPSAATS